MTFNMWVQREHVHLAPLLAQQPRGDQPVAAVVALAAEDRDPPRRRALPRGLWGIREPDEIHNGRRLPTGERF